MFCLRFFTLIALGLVLAGAGSAHAMRPDIADPVGIPEPFAEITPTPPPETLILEARITAVTENSVSLEGVPLSFAQTPAAIVGAYGQSSLSLSNLSPGMRVKALVSAHPLNRKIFTLWIQP